MRAALALFVVLTCTTAAHAHKPSDAYLRIGAASRSELATTVPLRWDLAVRDLDRVLGIDANRDGAITWGELRGADRATRDLLRAHLSATLESVPCAVTIAGGEQPRVTHHSDGAYAVYDLELRCPAHGDALALRYDLLFELDPQHRALVRNLASDSITVLSRQERSMTVSLPVAEPAQGRLWKAVREGVHHIWTGYDHLLFLLALLLPALLRREDGHWVPVPALRPALLEVLKVVTAFTAAHSVTLSLAALGALALPSRVVESAIALSVVLAALNNLWPVVRGDRWLAAFALGLLHGFGFSSTLADLGLSSSALLPTLVGFNLGVELGQAAVVAVFVPLAFLARRSPWYRRIALQLGSVLIAIVATLWLVERVANVVIISR